MPAETAFLPHGSSPYKDSPTITMHERLLREYHLWVNIYSEVSCLGRVFTSDASTTASVHINIETQAQAGESIQTLKHRCKQKCPYKHWNASTSTSIHINTETQAQAEESIQALKHKRKPWQESIFKHWNTGASKRAPTCACACISVFLWNIVFALAFVSFCKDS